jgi:glycogen debranching enzyme
MLIAHTAFKGFSARGWSMYATHLYGVVTDRSVKPITLSRSKIQFILGATVSTDFSKWKDDPKTHYGIPSKLTEITADKVVINTSNVDGKDESEIVVPDEFPPGSIILLGTEMAVSLTLLFGWRFSDECIGNGQRPRCHLQQWGR